MSAKLRVIFELFLFYTAHLVCIIFFLTNEISFLEFSFSILTSFFILVAGQEIGAHRLFSHHSFACSKLWRCLFQFVLCIGNYGSSLDWSYIHNIHHQYCDTEKDPTSPENFTALGLFSNYWKWVFVSKKQALEKVSGLRMLRKQPEAVFFHKHHVLIILTWNALLYTFFSAKGVILFSFVPMLFVSYALNSVSYFCHLRSKDTLQICHAKNVSWINLYMFGSGWHASHHEAPSKHRFSNKNDGVAWIIERIFYLK